MSLPDVFTKALKLVKSNAPEILTALGVTGVATTGYLTVKASFKAARMIDEAEKNRGGAAEDKKERLKERVQLVWPLFVPPLTAGAVTVACIIGSSKANAQRTAAAVTAYSITEKAFSEYKEKVVEQLGKGKEQRARDDLAQEKVAALPGQTNVIVLGDTEVLCCELYTGRFFKASVQKLQKAENHINGMLVREITANLTDFYDQIGLRETSTSDHLGWDIGRPMSLTFSTVLREDKPCLAFDYNYVMPLS